jgi:hypothetical protein
MADTRWEQWDEWKQRCALTRCGQETGRHLRRFAARRFRGFVERYLTRTNLRHASDLTLSDSDAWHLFESHSAAASTRGGKRYKHWLLARCKGSDESRRATAESGATLLIRTVVREFLHGEVSPRMTQSIDAPLPGFEDGPLTVAELLPAGDDPAEETHLRECARLAARHADTLFRAMTDQTRVALVSKALGISMAHRRVVKAARCRKTALYEAYQRFEHALAEDMGTAYGTQREDLRTIALMTLRSTFDRAVEWARAEKSCSGLFI